MIRRALTICLAPLILLLGLVAPSPTAVAAGDDYPYRTAANCAGQWGTYSWCVDENGNGSFQEAEVYSPWNFAYRNCTDFVAWRMRATNGVDFFNTMGGGRWSNANNWDSNAARLNYAVNGSPAPGAIAQTDAGGYGHVAWVRAVNGNGTVTIEEYNYGGKGSYHERTVAASAFRYIHVKDLAAPRNPNPFGALDEASSPAPGVLRVRGWAADPDAASGPLAVHVYANDQALAITANKYRPDVPGVHPGYGTNLGYEADLQFPLAGSLRVCAYAINVGAGDTNTQLGCRTVQVDSPLPFGSLDSAAGADGRRAVVQGWVADPSDKDGPISVHFYANGSYAGALATRVHRPDVPKAIGSGYGDHLGFSGVLRLPADGHVRLCAFGINVGPGWGNPELGCREFDVARTLYAPAPSASGVAKVGSVLTAKPGDWQPAPVALAYQWYRSGKAITGATKATYLITGADYGTTITVRVTGSRTGYPSITRTSPATVRVAAGTLTAATPRITGTRKVGRSLTSKPGSWKPAGVTFSYQWYRNGKRISGATKATYKLTRASKGKRITVRVTGRKAGYAAIARTSARTTRVR